MNKLPPDLQKWRDAEAARCAHSYFNAEEYGQCLRVEDVVEGAIDAFYEKLCSEGSEFPQDGYMEWLKENDDVSWYEHAVWGFEQGKAREAALRARIKELEDDNR